MERCKFDHYDADYMRDPYAGYAQLRAECPVAHVDKYGGFYVLSRHREVYAAAQQYDVFSSKDDALAIPPNEARPLPITTDPPLHRRYRMVMAAYFSPRRVERIEPDIRALAAELIDGFIERRACDISAEYSAKLPTLMLARMLGVPLSDTDLFHHWINTILYKITVDPAASSAAAAELNSYVADLIARSQPGDDTFLSVLRDAPLDDGPFRDDELVRMVVQLIFGALHTTAYLINGAILMLDDDPAARARLIAEPTLFELATEEFLRLISPVQALARKVTQPADRFGQHFETGDRVMLLWASANRDHDEFPDPDDLKLDRFPNRHVAFGVGIHRCVGAPLGRMQFKVCMQELLARLPGYSVPDRDAVEWGVASTRGIKVLPIVW